MPLVGFYGDDFTGSIDALLQYRLTGLTGALATSPRAVARLATGVDVVGIAGTARSVVTAAMEDQVRPALEALAATNPAIVQYKACSTVDSSPQLGSLGRVLEIALGLFGPVPIPVLFAQPDFGRYTVFGNHFAREGDLVHRLDRHPTMAHHPATPILEADLRRHLSRQTSLPIGSVSWTDYDRLAEGIRECEDAAVVLDGFTDEHLETIGAAILADPRRPRFVLGAGGMSRGLGRSLVSGRGRADLPPRDAPASVSTLVLSGSLSPLTREQTASAVASGWMLLDLFDPDVLAHVVDGLQMGKPVIASSGRTGRREHDPRRVEDRLAEIGDVALAREPRTRIVITGGDTSGRVLGQWGVDELEIVAAPWREVPLCRARGSTLPSSGIEVVLKGGQTGYRTLFDDIHTGRALHAR